MYMRIRYQKNEEYTFVQIGMDYWASFDYQFVISDNYITT